MEWVLVSALLLGSVLVWGFVKVLELATAWKILEELEKAKEIIKSYNQSLENQKIKVEMLK